MTSAIFLTLTILYGFLQSHYIFGGDSAEYSTIARTWGIAHPPGYPLYSFLANVLNRTIPFFTTPWKVALLSSVPTIITAYILYKILCIVKVHKYCALAASILYLFLFPVWQYGLIPEVFALHTMLISLITYALLLYSQSRKKRLLLWASFLCGLCISNHHIFVLFIPGWLYLMKEHVRRVYHDKRLLILLLTSILIGACFYLYVIITSMNSAVLDWENAKTLQGFLRLITRSSYGSFKAYSSSGANIVNQLSDMVSGLVFILLDFKPLGMIFIGVGLWASRKYGKKFAGFLLISLFTHFIFLFYTNFVLTSAFSSGMFERFLIPLYVILILYFGIGVDYALRAYFMRIVAIIKNPRLKMVTYVSYFVFVGIFLLFIAVRNYKTISLIANENTVQQFGMDIVNTVPQDSILTAQSDTTSFAASYQIYGLEERRDVVFLQLGQINKENYISMIKKRFPSLIISDSVIKSGELEKFIKNNGARGYYAEWEMKIGVWRPYGLLWKYYPDETTAATDSAALLASNKRLWEQVYSIPILSGNEKNIFHLNSVGEYYINAYQNYAKLLVFMEMYPEAENVLKNIVEKYKPNDLQAKAEYLNILVLQEKCQYASQIAKKMNLSSTVKLYPGFAFSALRYLEICDSHNSAIPQYEKIFAEYQKSHKTNLNSF